MTREEARKAAKVLEAFARGKELEWCNDTGVWLPAVNPTFNFNDNKYRIKEEPKYRPFKDKEECWNEIQKHSPFGWVKTKHNTYGLISYIRTLNNIEEVMINVASYDFKEAFDVFTFIDGTPFGIKEE